MCVSSRDNIRCSVFIGINIEGVCVLVSCGCGWTRHSGKVTAHSSLHDVKQHGFKIKSVLRVFYSLPSLKLKCDILSDWSWLNQLNPNKKPTRRQYVSLADCLFYLLAVVRFSFTDLVYHCNLHRGLHFTPTASFSHNLLEYISIQELNLSFPFDFQVSLCICPTIGLELICEVSPFWRCNTAPLKRMDRWEMVKKLYWIFDRGCVWCEPKTMGKYRSTRPKQRKALATSSTELKNTRQSAALR